MISTAIFLKFKLTLNNTFQEIEGVGLFRQQSMTITNTHVLHGDHERMKKYMLDSFMDMGKKQIGIKSIQKET